MDIKYDNLLVLRILKESKKEISSYLKINNKQFDNIIHNLVIRAELCGHNNQIYLIDFFDDRKNLIGDVCLKYSLKLEKKEGLQVEFNILNILRANNIFCPSVIDANFSNEQNSPYILMETVKGKNVNDHDLDIQEAESILDAIQLHELVLRNNLQTPQLLSSIPDLHKEIDFEDKLSNLLSIFTPGFITKDSFDFLNHYLNNPEAIKKRIIVTDRSVENIFIGRDNQIIMVDFSTIRVGTQFDNWIQFIDDPRITFSCSKEDLISLFFKKNNLQKKELNSFYASSIYTNLLQGIFTYQKNPQLGIGYINNANNSFKKLTKKKSVLIDIGH